MSSFFSNLITVAAPMLASSAFAFVGLLSNQKAKMSVKSSVKLFHIIFAGWDNPKPLQSGICVGYVF